MPLLLLLAAAAVPHPAPLKLYRDWIVGCDNGRACHAVALAPENGEGATMAVKRGPEAEAPVVIDFTLDGAGAAGLAADGKRLAVHVASNSDGAIVAAVDVPAVIAALRSARSLTLLDAKGGSLGDVSLAGASAALLYMDDVQGRVGTVTALARAGAKAASSIAPPPPVPIVRAAPAASGPALALMPARVAALRREQSCRIEEVGGPAEIERYKLDGDRTLILLSCGSGAYNLSMVPLIAVRRGGRVEIAPALFDLPPEQSDAGKPVLVNADWDPKTRLLSSINKGRGIGDCGVHQEYAWDGARFRLVEQDEMSECRGSLDYITTWRARVVGQ